MGRFSPSKLSPGADAAQRTLNDAPQLKTPRLTKAASAASLTGLSRGVTLSTLPWSSSASSRRGSSSSFMDSAEFDEETSAAMALFPATEYGLRLEEAITTATKMRAETSRAHAESLTGIDPMFTPHGQDARTKARALVSQVTRATSRLAAALHALEVEAVAAQRAHAVELLSVKRHFGEELSRKEMELKRKAQEFEAERVRILTHAEHLSGQLASAQATADDGWKEASGLLEVARRAQDELKAESVRLRAALEQTQRELDSERASRAAETTQLRQANEQQQLHLVRMSADLERARRQLVGEVGRLEAEKTAAVGELHSQLGHVHELRLREVGMLQEELNELSMRRSLSESAMHADLQAIQADRESEQRHWQMKLERLKGLHKTVLNSSSARGRQLLYGESLRQEDGGWAPSSMTWRGEDWRQDSGARFEAQQILKDR